MVVNHFETHHKYKNHFLSRRHQFFVLENSINDFRHFQMFIILDFLMLIFSIVLGPTLGSYNPKGWRKALMCCFRRRAWRVRRICAPVVCCRLILCRGGAAKCCSVTWRLFFHSHAETVPSVFCAAARELFYSYAEARRNLHIYVYMEYVQLLKLCAPQQYIKHNIYKSINDII